MSPALTTRSSSIIRASTSSRPTWARTRRRPTTPSWSSRSPATSSLRPAGIASSSPPIQHNYLGGNVGNAVMIDPNTRFLNGAPNPYFGEPFTVRPAAGTTRQPGPERTGAALARLPAGFHRRTTLDQVARPSHLQAFLPAPGGGHECLELPAGSPGCPQLEQHHGRRGPGGAPTERPRRALLPGQRRRGHQLRRRGVREHQLHLPADLVQHPAERRDLDQREHQSRVRPWSPAPPIPQQQVWSYAGSVQDYLLNDRLVLTLGQRHDYERSRTTPTATIDPSTGLPTPTTWRVQQLGLCGRHHPAGGRRRPSDQMAERPLQPVRQLPVAGLGEDQFGNVLPNPERHGQGLRASLSFFEDKLVAEMNWYSPTRRTAAKAPRPSSTGRCGPTTAFLSLGAAGRDEQPGRRGLAQRDQRLRPGIVQFPTGLAGLAAASQSAPTRIGPGPGLGIQPDL